MSSSGNSIRIELLTKHNYDAWSMQVEALLTKNNLWEYVNGVKKEPVVKPDDSTSVAAYSA